MKNLKKNTNLFKIKRNKKKLSFFFIKPDLRVGDTSIRNVPPFNQLIIQYVEQQQKIKNNYFKQYYFIWSNLIK